jgi:hypothetical protein
VAPLGRSRVYIDREVVAHRYGGSLGRSDGSLTVHLIVDMQSRNSNPASAQPATDCTYSIFLGWLPPRTILRLRLSSVRGDIGRKRVPYSLKFFFYVLKGTRPQRKMFSLFTISVQLHEPENIHKKNASCETVANLGQLKKPGGKISCYFPCKYLFP